ncbi:DUF2726 domain-containing protein, partial [Methylophaga sp.]|uniref:DUF2726 domain-containing protein n=1 Tax=Methylophaga sp. TaxID=2024840 RepID=UPI003F69796C
MQFMAAVLIVFLLAVWALVRLSRNKTESTVRIQKQDLLLDSSLRDFRKRLVDAFKDDFDIYPCVRLADLLKVSYRAGDKSSEAFQQKVLSLSVDFVLIDQLNGKVACLVQMDKELENTDQYRFLERSCQQANLPLVH